jgi:hypothetical protein
MRGHLPHVVELSRALNLFLSILYNVNNESQGAYLQAERLPHALHLVSSISRNRQHSKNISQEGSPWKFSLHSLYYYEATKEVSSSDGFYNVRETAPR